MKYFVAISVYLFLCLQLSHAAEPINAPEQVHISLGTDETEMLITWATVHHIEDTPEVEYGTSESNLTLIRKAEISHLTADGANVYTYRALLTSLKPETKYYYRVGSKSSAWSKVFHFRTLPVGNKWLPKFAVYGDLGFQNEKSLPFLTKDVEKSMYDVIFHVGDFAYDLYEVHGEQGNDFMRSIEKVAAFVPYQTCPGNHEEKSNFTHYDLRFSMIGDRHEPNHNAPINSRLNNFFHSVDIGPAHILQFTTEFYYYTHYGWDQIVRQFEFLEQDLKRANQNRAERPWLIVMGHRPLYCIKIGDDSCNYDTLERADIRQGIHMNGDKKSHIQYGLEDLFYKYGVDLLMYGHEHFYGRFMPVYNYTIMGGSDKNPYENPRAPVHITTGSAGNREEHPPFNPKVLTKDWLANHHYDYGFTRLVFKDTHRILLEQVSDDKGGEVTDSIEISKSSNIPKWLL